MTQQTMKAEKATSLTRDIKICVCDVCKGAGKKIVFTGRGNEDEHYTEPCRQCDGSGMVKRVITIDTYPYSNRSAT